jgi:hypothetical protein
MTSEPELRPDLDPRHTFPTGASVIHHGLPELPEVLAHQMSIPISYWTATGCAVVTFLRFRPHPVNSEIQPTATTVCYAKNGDTWTGRQGMYAGRRFAFDPVTKPGQAPDLHGRAMVYGGSSQTQEPEPGYPASVASGLAAPEVKYVALIQDNTEDRRKLKSHFGAWVVCTEKPGPFHVAAFNDHGVMLATLQHPFPPGPTPDGTHH